MQNDTFWMELTDLNVIWKAVYLQFRFDKLWEQLVLLTKAVIRPRGVRKPLLSMYDTEPNKQPFSSCKKKKSLQWRAKRLNCEVLGRYLTTAWQSQIFSAENRYSGGGLKLQNLRCVWQRGGKEAVMRRQGIRRRGEGWRRNGGFGKLLC